MKRRISALLLSAILCFSLMGTAFANDGGLKFTADVMNNVTSVTVTNGTTDNGKYIGVVWNYTGSFNVATATRLAYFDATVTNGTVNNLTVNFGKTVAAGSVLRVVVNSTCWCEATVKDANPGGGDVGGSVGVGGGGDGGVPATVNVAPSKSGKITVSNPNAKAGDTVQVTVTPDNGYETEAVTVKDKAGKALSVTKNADGTFSFTMPKASLLPVSVEASFKATSTAFIDVPADAYYADAVAWAVSKGVTKGKDEANTFKPNDVCTRAEAVTFLYRAAGEPEVALTQQFKDVAADTYYTKAVAWAVANGITNGKGETDTFAPNDICTRAEIVTFLARFEKAASVTNTQFKDVAADAYYAGAVGWAVNNGITKGKGETSIFAPNDACTRAEIVTFLYRDFVK